MTETATEEQKLRNKIKQMGTEGMFGKVAPCNPIPFLLALADGCRGNTPFIKTDEAQTLLHIINRMSYGEGAVIDLYQEYYDKYDRMCERGTTKQ